MAICCILEFSDYGKQGKEAQSACSHPGNERRTNLAYVEGLKVCSIWRHKVLMMESGARDEVSISTVINVTAVAALLEFRMLQGQQLVQMWQCAPSVSTEYHRSSYV